ncbi:MAG: hypothetical protein EOM28_07205 [Clostridia bacterium]|nr:hypothetical protein [Clostridia bacterium]
MLGHFGFSYIGLFFLLMLFIPNFIWTKRQPRGYTFKFENKILVFLEKLGQILVTTTALIFSDFNLHDWSNWSYWLIASIFFLSLYEFWWFRYFSSHQTLSDFYSDFFGIPVAGATLPVIAFLLLGIYGRVIWLIIFTVILGIGHIGIHLQHQHEITSFK